VPDAHALATPHDGPRSWCWSASSPVTAVPVMPIAVSRGIASAPSPVNAVASARVPQLGAGQPGPDDAAEAIAEVGARVGQPGVGHRLGGGGQRVQHAGLLARGEPAARGADPGREVDDGAADAEVLGMLGRQPRRGVRADAARAGARATERDRQRVAERTHHAQSGDGDLR
jgi:hypothetical protein